MRWARRTGLALAALALGFATLTWTALEAGDVAVVETRAPDGDTRKTHVWFVERDGELWLEAGAPENRWVQDVQRDPRLEIRIDGLTHAARAELVPERSAQVRSWLREKYGWRDVWVGLLVDASRSTAVRLREAERG